MSDSFKIEFRFWISSNDQPLIGKGKINLLQKIEETGSIRKAAEEMKLSYRKAYYSIEQINKLAEKPVVIMIRGGKNGGKSVLTDYGRMLILKYKNLEEEISAFLAKKSF